MKCQKMSKRTNIKIVLGGSDGSKNHFQEAWRRSIVRRRGWSERNKRRRGHAKRNLLVGRRGQESLQRLARHKRRMRHVTGRGNGPV